MASNGWRNRQGPTSQVSNLSFFTMVLAQALEEGKLEIPGTIVRQCGDRLGRTMFLKVPNGAQWGIDLTKCNGEIGLLKGWSEFAEHYSLEQGSVLQFSSEGDYSHFGVQIFKRNTLEINYPPLVEMNYPPNSDRLSITNKADAYDDDDGADDNSADGADEDDGDARSGESGEDV